jgi:ABC-type sugar transport system substrate-binding protein
MVRPGKLPAAHFRQINWIDAMKPTPFSVVSILVVLLCVQCTPINQSPEASQQPTSHKITIGFSTSGLDAAQVAIMDGLIKQAEEKGWQVLTATANRSPKVQIEQIDYFLTRGVDVIVCVPEDSQAICSSVKKARQAGIPFYTIDRAPIGCEIEMTVLADNHMAGKQAAEAVIKFLQTRYGSIHGTILELQGDLTQNVAQLRGAGFHEVVDPYKDITVISKPTEWKVAKFADYTQEVVGSTKVDAIFLHSDCVGLPVILPILDQMGKKLPRDNPNHIFIAGVDGCPETLQAIRAGYADQTSSQPIPDYGIITRWIEMNLNGETITAGAVTEEGALWSPASLEMGPTGWQLLLATTSVMLDNVSQPALWGNH